MRRGLPTHMLTRMADVIYFVGGRWQSKADGERYVKKKPVPCLWWIGGGYFMSGMATKAEVWPGELMIVFNNRRIVTKEVAKEILKMTGGRK